MGVLDGKTAIVTGAASGIGQATADLFLREGASVIRTDIRFTSAADGRGSDRYLDMYHDVANPDHWVRIVSASEAHFGPVGILINNAGIMQAVLPIDELSVEEYRRVIDVNQLSVFLGMRAVVASMRRAGGGSIINMSSAVGLVGAARATAYVASKFAITGMTKSAALDLGADKIRVNSVHPGHISTPLADSMGDGHAGRLFAEQLPLRRGGLPAEVARLMLFLATDASSFCTGASYCVDGGWTAA